MVAHFEIVVTDIPRAKEFYEKVFGWKFEKWENPGTEYWMIMAVPSNTPGAINGGMRLEMGTDVKERTRSVNGYICTIVVESVDDILKAVEGNGGEILMPKTHMKGVGHIASCLDTEGNMFSLMQAE